MRQFRLAALTVLSAALLVRDRRARRRTERLAAAALEVLLGAIDANDADTGAHVRRVASYSLLLARAAGLRGRRLHEVERVALFHDVGKIHAALFDIVHDEDADLSPRERKLVATHPQRGAEVLAPLADFYPELPAAVLSHHERWDGSGYPRGLAGEAIPLTARIVAITDTYDAITARRSYRDARSTEEARRVISEGGGLQFDPALAGLFLSRDVEAAVAQLRREWTLDRPASAGRRSGRASESAPDITFRWRGGAGVPPPPDPGRRTARE